MTRFALDHPNNRKTGGFAYETTNHQSIEDIYSQIEDVLRNQYSIGYTPARPADGKFHRIKLTTRDRRLVVKTRDGYYGASVRKTRE